MKRRAAKSRSRAGKPVKRVSAVKKKRNGFAARHYLVRSWWILRGAFVGILVLSLVYGAYLGFGKISDLESLSVKVIEVDGCQGVRPESIKRLVGVTEGDPLLRVDLKEVRLKVVSHPAIKNATVVRELPNTLRISVQERTPAALVLGREFALVDSDGFVMSLYSSYMEGYPLVTGISEIPEPGRLMAGSLPALEILRNISLSGFVDPGMVSEIEMSPDLIRVSLMGSGTVLVLGHEDSEVQIQRLARLVEAGVFDTRLAGYDLRFEGRVIGVPERKPGGSGARSHAPAGG